MAKPERNDPCPCGSGQKYKRCCLAKDQEAESAALKAAAEALGVSRPTLSNLLNGHADLSGDMPLRIE